MSRESLIKLKIGQVKILILKNVIAIKTIVKFALRIKPAKEMMMDLHLMMNKRTLKMEVEETILDKMRGSLVEIEILTITLGGEKEII